MPQLTAQTNGYRAQALSITTCATSLAAPNLQVSSKAPHCNGSVVLEFIQDDTGNNSFYLLRLYIYIYIYIYICRSQWPRSLRRRSTAASLLRSWVRIPPGAWMFVCCECCVLSGRGLCDGLIIRSEESYRLWCVVVCDQETS